MVFDEPIGNGEIFDFNRNENTPFRMDQGEIPADRITVFIRLSRAQDIRAVESSLSEVLQDMEFEKRGNDITVTAYPREANFGEDDVLAIVQKHDRHAVRI